MATIIALLVTQCIIEAYASSNQISGKREQTGGLDLTKDHSRFPIQPIASAVYFSLCSITLSFLYLADCPYIII